MELPWTVERNILRLQQFFSGYSNLPFKEYCELRFWIKMKKQIINNYKSSSKNECGSMSSSEVFLAAIRHYMSKDSDKYLRCLGCRESVFTGRKVLDVGSGPLPYATSFEDCEIACLDSLLPAYRRVGFPLDQYHRNCHYLEGGVESIPSADSSYDVVVSVNALDHVDDFAKAAYEIQRVLKPDGILWFHVHYHKPSTTEPWALDDAIIRECFGQVKLQKIHGGVKPSLPDRETAVWSTHPELSTYKEIR